jgi:hypothetical protein
VVSNFLLTLAKRQKGGGTVVLDEMIKLTKWKTGKEVKKASKKICMALFT